MADAGHGFAGNSDARVFDAPPEQQRVFARQVHFAEARRRPRVQRQVQPAPGSFLRGRQAIAALFPAREAGADYAGGITMYGGAGVQTRAGGDIQVLTPGGAGLRRKARSRRPRRAYSTQAAATSSSMRATASCWARPRDAGRTWPVGAGTSRRSRSNINIHAQQVLNAANIKTQGESVGVPVAASVNTGALRPAPRRRRRRPGLAQRAQNQARQNQPSIISVQILGFGDEPTAGAASSRGRGSPERQAAYRRDGAVQVVGDGPWTPRSWPG